MHRPVVMSRHGMATVLGHLGVEPAVDGIDELRIVAGIFDLGAVRQIPILDPKLSRLSTAQFGESRHGCPVNTLGIGEIAAGELRCNLAQMPANQVDLRAIGGVLDDDLL